MLHSRVRYFDPVKRRAGLTKDVGALVSKIDTGGITLTLVNTNPVEERSITVQAGAYGEHHFETVEIAGKAESVDARDFTVQLKAGSGVEMRIVMRRFTHQPDLAFPWNRVN